MYRSSLCSPVLIRTVALAIILGLGSAAACAQQARVTTTPTPIGPTYTFQGGGNPVAAGLAQALGGEALYQATQPSAVVVASGGYLPYTTYIAPAQAQGLPLDPDAGAQVAPGVTVYPAYQGYATPGYAAPVLPNGVEPALLGQ